MIHQHFKLVDVFSAAENIVLGLEDERQYDIRKDGHSASREISERYGFDIDPNKKIYEMSVSEKQTVEIVKVLYRGADILILDEPTAVLTPQETQKLFAILRKMRADGKSIIIITHKLNEVMEISDRVSVLRKGEYVGTDRDQRSQRSRSLTEMMVGKKVGLNIDRSAASKSRRNAWWCSTYQLHQHARACKLLDDVSFTARSRRNSGHRRHCRQRPEGAAGSHRRACSTSTNGRNHLSTIPRPARTVDLSRQNPAADHANWACASPSCRRIDWAWAWSATWT